VSRQVVRRRHHVRCAEPYLRRWFGTDAIRDAIEDTTDEERSFIGQDEAALKELRAISAETGISQQELVAEGLNYVLTKYGKRSVAR
jgi:Ribbon-helix-helix domain